MNPKALEFSKQIAHTQLQVACEYLNPALLKYLKHPEMKIFEAQKTVGELGIAIELLSKSFINEHGLLLTMQNCDDRTKIAFSSSDDKLAKKYLSDVLNEIQSNGSEAIDFSKAIGMLNLFEVNLTKETRGKLELLRKARNDSLHGFLSKRYWEALPKIVYGVLKTAQAIEIASGKKIIVPIALVEKFVADFEADESNTLFERIRCARICVAEDRLAVFSAVVFHLDELILNCPICKLDAVATGKLSSEDDTGNFGYVEKSLFFYPGTIECGHCGIKLKDEDELYVVGVRERIKVPFSIETYGQDKRRASSYYVDSYRY